MNTTMIKRTKMKTRDDDDDDVDGDDEVDDTDTDTDSQNALCTQMNPKGPQTPTEPLKEPLSIPLKEPRHS